MRIIDERFQVKGIAARWKAQYVDRLGNDWTFANGRSCIDVYRQLLALSDDTATAKDVAAILGNSSWAGPSDCHECGQSVERTVELGQPPDYESHTAQICEACLRKALDLITGAK